MKIAKIAEVITALVIEKLNQGIIPWNKPWSGGECPKNLITKKRYRGINVFTLLCMGYDSPYWLSFKQAQKLGGTVRKGEKSVPVVFWEWVIKKNEDGEPIEEKIPMLRYYRVFNLSQIEGIDQKHIPESEVKLTDFDKINRCETVVINMPKKPAIIHCGNSAFYRLSDDTVIMPPFNQFETAEEYYSTIFHELVHSTEHETRLNRKGENGYSKEEIIAEMGAAFLCGHCQIENKTIDNSAAYINEWLDRLSNDKKVIIFAAAQAQKACDFILSQSYE